MSLQNLFHTHRWIKWESTNHLQTQLATSWTGWKFHEVNYNSWWDVGSLARWQNYPHGLKKQNRAEWIWRPCLAFSSTVKVWCIMSSFLQVKQWIKNSTWLFYAVHNKSFQRNEWSWQECNWFLDHNVTTHSLPHVQQNVTKKISELPQLLYNLEVSPSDSTLFPKFKVSLKGCSGETAEEIQERC
jgi:hypothetical protein